ncbi:MAG: hypothetical protein IJL06_08500 [Kiritimatiellae bacterium]|nr:hypothetical protein [Kiritimatiellia bacterium]
MKNFPFKSARALVAAAAAFAASFAVAQGPAAAPAGPSGTNPGDVKITKLSDLSHDYRQKAKSIDGKTSQKSRIWGVFDVTFQTTPAWIDSMTVTYTVILLNQKADTKKGEKPMTLMQTTVEYGDVQQDREHKAGAVVLPAALLRLGEPIGFAATISVGGKEVASQGVAKNPALQKAPEWWKNPDILNHPNVQRRDAYMMDRMKSPFQLVDPDDYELSR